MANLLHSTAWQHTADGSTSFTVTIPSTAASSVLVLVSMGGATVQGKLGGTSGTNFTLRAASLGSQEVKCQDITDSSGSTTSIGIVLNASQNVQGVIFEFASLGAFMSSVTKNTVYTQSSAQKVTQNSLTVTGNAVLLSAFSADNTQLAGARALGIGPNGQVYQNLVNTGSGRKFYGAVHVGDVTAAGFWPFSNSAGVYQPQVTYGLTGLSVFAATWAYTDSSGVATNPAVNAIVSENRLAGDFRSTWMTSANLDGTIAGYTDAVSYTPGSTVNLAVDSGNAVFTADMFRVGHYGGDLIGARKVGSVSGSAVVQASPTVDNGTGGTGSTICAWTTNASWTIPSNAVPGYYIALVSVSSHFYQIPFIVKPSGTPTGKVCVVASTATWQAYNSWGATTDTSGSSGRSLYGANADGSLAHRAFGVSFNRPYSTLTAKKETWWLDSEYGMLQFLEAQGFDLSYFTDVDMDSNTSLLTAAKVVVMNGHHEYYSLKMRQCIESALRAGVNFFYNSANTFFWRVRWSVDRRTMYCYKDSEDLAGWDTTTKYDPVSYTGTWRDTRTNGGGVNNPLRLPESGLGGLWFIGNGPQTVRLQIPFARKTSPIWRNCPDVQALTVGNNYSPTNNLIGYEFDYVNSAEATTPTNLAALSDTSITLTNQAATINGPPETASGTFTHQLVFWMYASGALSFNAGTWRWSWGLGRHYNGIYNSAAVPDLNIQNATLNILRDMGAIATSIQVMSVTVDSTAPTDPGSAVAASSYGLTTPQGSWGPIAIKE